MQNIGRLPSLSNVQRSNRCYTEGVLVANNHEPMGKEILIRLSCYFVKTVRALFSDDEYKGFRYSDYHSDVGY